MQARDAQDTYVTFRQFDEEFTFYIENPTDHIQSRLASGKLYETEELEIIREYSPSNGVFYDVGANVGTHTIFMAKVLKARKVYPFEANRRALDILRRNIIANKLSGRVDDTFLGLGVGLDGDRRHVFNPQDNNLGAARLKKRPETGGDDQTGYFHLVEIRSIDTLDIANPPDFVKIDVEGMEIAALRGMGGVIQNSRPPIFVEVNNNNIEKFHLWRSENDYEVTDTYSRYDSSVNFMVLPRGG